MITTSVTETFSQNLLTDVVLTLLANASVWLVTKLAQRVRAWGGSGRPAMPAESGRTRLQNPAQALPNVSAGHNDGGDAVIELRGRALGPGTYTGGNGGPDGKGGTLWILG